MIKRTLLLCGLIILTVAGIAVIIIGNYNKTTLVRFESEPQATVYVDNIKVGLTPIDFETRKRKINISLVAYNKRGLVPYETTLSLTPQTKVIVRRNLGSDLSLSSGQIIQFLETHKNVAEITFVTTPVNSTIYVDNLYAGLSPLTISPPRGTKSVKIESEGYKPSEFTIQTAADFLVLVTAELETNQPTLNKPQSIATISDTKLGFLNVRSSPVDSSNSITRVFPGREYSVLGFNSDKSWINIQLNASESGWISSQFATVSAQIETPP